MKNFGLLMIALMSFYLLACSGSSQEPDTNINASMDYTTNHNSNDVELEKYYPEIDNSCNTNILCNIENAYSHYDAMNQDLQISRIHQPIYNKNVNGYFALQCGSDFIRNIARYRISNSERIDIVTRNGEHLWCKGNYKLTIFLRGKRLKPIKWKGGQETIKAIPSSEEPIASDVDYQNGLDNIDDINDLELEDEFYHHESEFETDCGETDCEFIDENGYDDGL